MRRFLIASTILFGFSLPAQTAIESSQVRNEHVTLTTSARSIKLAFKAPDLGITSNMVEGVALDSITLPEEGYTYEKDRPVLPAMTRVVIVPATAGLELVVEAGTPRIERAEHPPVFCTESDTDHADEISGNATPTGLFPAQIAEMSEPFLIRGVRLVRVTTYPVQYDAANGNFIHHDNIQAEVRFTDAAPVNPSLHPIRHMRSPVFTKFLRNLAINGDELGRDDPERDAPAPYLGHYLVVVHTGCLQYVTPFLEWRRQQGYNVELLVLTANQAGTPSTVKNLIKERWDAYVNHGLDPFDYIMLIGDHESYDNAGGGPSAIIATDLGTVCWNGNAGHHFDYNFACLDGGNDIYADCGISRWAAGDANMLALNVYKTLEYETLSWMTGQNANDTAWFSRAGVYGQHWSGSWHVSLHTTVRWAFEVMKHLGYTDVRHYEDIGRVESQGEGVGPFISEQFNDGVAVTAGRAENYHYRNGMQNVQENTHHYPIDLDIAGHHEWSCWWMIRTGSKGHLAGPVAATTGWGNLVTGPNNVTWMEEVNGFMIQDQPFAIARMQAVIAPTVYIPNFYNSFPCVPTDVQFYGDPAIQAWKGTPRRVQADIPAEVTTKTSRVDVLVHVPGEDTPVPGADVTLYFPGNMPDSLHHDEYGNYNDMQMWTLKSDENGVASFAFGDDVRFVNRTKMYVTVSGRDIKPFQANRTIGTPARVVDVASYVMSEVSGNGDDFVNPGEDYDLHITAANLGTEALDNVSAHVSSLSPFVSLQEDDVVFGAIDARAEAEGDRRIAIHISNNCPDGVSRPIMRPVIDVEFTSGDLRWMSAIKLTPHAPHLEFRQVVGGNIVQDTATTLNIEIANVGSVASQSVSARLRSLGMGVTVVTDVAAYGSIAVGNTGRVNGNRFMLSGNRIVPPGSTNKMQLILSSDDGFTDTTNFVVQIMRPRARAPQGPDKYGYICFDDTDTDWDIAPEYNWIEIDRRDQNADFAGTSTGFRGNVEIGESVVLDLPFTTQFYGVEYDQITVALNGFVALGDQDTIINFQNWPLDRAIGGGAGMIAPFWDKLSLGQNGQVYTYYDEDSSRFIVEWSRVKCFGGNNEITFQVFILDKHFGKWITESGDPNIIMQYKTISQFQGNDTPWGNDTPYASVGISSPGGTGINYSWNNTYPITSAELAARRTLLFTTSPTFRAGMLFGMVSDAATGLGIPGATVFTEHGFIANTDADGNWRILEALAEVRFKIWARHIGYNDSAYADLRVAEGDSLRIDFYLLHPEFTISNDQLGANLEPGQQIQIPFTVDNTGNGPLVWSAEKRLIGDANAAPWEFRRSVAVGDTVDDDRIEGVVFANDHYYFSGANGADSSLIYCLDRDGVLVDSIEQPTHTHYGMKDIEWDGEYLWGSGDSVITCFTTRGEVITTFSAPYNPCNNIAWDSDNDLLWVSGTTTNLINGMDRAGNIVHSLPRLGLRMYGLGYWPDDPDGNKLYLVTNPGPPDPRPLIYKMNTETGDTIRAKTLELPAGATDFKGCYISNQFDVYSWVLMTVANIAPGSGGDRLQIYQLDARKDWLNLDLWSGGLQTQERQDFVLTLNTAGLPDTLFEGEMRFTHNADDNSMVMHVWLNVLGERQPGPFGLAIPADNDTLTALPLHGDTLHVEGLQFAWNRSIDPNDLDVVMYRFNIGVGDRRVALPLQFDTTLTVNPDTLGLAISIDQPVIWYVEAVSGNETTESTSRFRLHVKPNAVDLDKFVKPFEFALSPASPNPFNSRTTIRYSLDKDAAVSLRLYDLEGRSVATLVQGSEKAGWHKLTLDGNDLSSGVYMLRLESRGRMLTSKVTMVK